MIGKFKVYCDGDDSDAMVINAMGPGAAAEAYAGLSKRGVDDLDGRDVVVVALDTAARATRSDWFEEDGEMFVVFTVVPTIVWTAKKKGKR